MILTIIILFMGVFAFLSAFAKKEKPVYTKPELKVKSTVVPKSFTDEFKSWDNHLFENQITVN